MTDQIIAPPAPVALAVPPPVAPAPPPRPAAAPPAPPPAPPAPPVGATLQAPKGKTLAEVLGTANEPDEAAKRLARAGRKALEVFGIKVGKGEDVEAAAADYKSKRDADKEERKTLKAQAVEAKDYKEQVTAYLATEMPKLSPQEQAIIKARAGESPLKQLQEFNYLQSLRAGGVIAAAAAPAAAPAAPAAPAPLAAPATSAPPAPGPAPTPTTSTNHKANYDALVAKANGGGEGAKGAHMQATAYLHQHRREIYPSLSK